MTETRLLTPTSKKKNPGEFSKESKQYAPIMLKSYENLRKKYFPTIPKQFEESASHAKPSGLSSLFMWVRGLDFFVDCKEEKHDIHSM